MTVYFNGLANPWQDAGNNGTVVSNAAVYSGSNSISVTITNAYAGIEFLHAPTNDTDFGSIQFGLNGGASGGQYLEMHGILDFGNGVRIPQSARYLLSRPAANTWQQYTVPLATLGVANVTNFAGFAIQDRAGGAEPVFYLDDIELTNSAAPLPQLTVNAGHPIRTADARWFGIGTPIWDEYLTNTPQTLNLLTNMGTQALRFPGGSAADQFHWSNNVGDIGKGPFHYGPSLSNFIQVVTNLNAQTMITVNYGSGTPNEAAAWVAYLNATTNNPQYLGVDSTGTDWKTAGYWASLRATNDGTNFLCISRPDPLGFKNWEIGNEIFGYWETDNNFVPHDPYTYAKRAQEYISLMKAVDPTIKIGVVAVPGVSNYINNYNHTAVDPVTGRFYNGWTPVMLATLAGLDVTPDMAITHWYPENPTYENDTLLLESAMGSASPWATNAADLRGQISDFMGAKGSNMELVCTENNSDVAQPGKQSVSLVNGLYKADTLGQLMQTEFNGLFWHDFRDGAIEYDGNMSPALYGWRMYGDFGVATLTNGATAYTNLYPTYYTSELIRRFAQGGDMVVAAASDYSLLSVYAVRRQNGKLTLLAINKDPLNTNTAQVSVAGFTPATNVTVYSYGIPQDFAAQIGSGSQDISTNNISVTGTTFSNSFPPYSATVMVLSPASIGSNTMTVTSSQNPALAGSSVTFTATVSGNGGVPTGYVVFKYGPANLGIGTLNSSGTASLSNMTLSVGSNAITAVYSGDGYYAGSINSALLQIITNKTGVSTNGLSASWLFNEGSGTNVADSSGNGNTGTLNTSGNGNPGTVNDTPVWEAGAGLNGSNTLAFPGTYVPGAAYVSAPDSVTLADQGIGSNLTIFAWVKRSDASIGNNSAVVAKDTPFDTFPYHRNYELIFDTTNHLMFAYRNSVGTSWEFYSSSNVYADTGSWHFYSVTYTYGTATNCTLYVDGAAVAGSWVAGNGSDAPASTSGGPVLIGIDGTGTTSYGSTYEGISIYSSNLLGSQVNALYEGGIKPGAASMTTVTNWPNSTQAGSNVTFTATVSGSSGTPTGTVVFFDGNNILTNVTLNSSGVAILSTALSGSVSNHPIVAVYDGDDIYGASSSSVFLQIIAFQPSTTTINPSQNPAAAGSMVTFTATVSGSNGPPTGTVVFKDGTNNLGSVLLNAGVAVFSTSALSVSGSPHSMTAEYSGDSTYVHSTSGVLLQTINYVPSATIISSSPNPAWAASNVTFTATVSGSGGMPTGTVVFFYDVTNNLGSNTLNSLGMASVTNSALPVAGSPHSVTAVYGGDSIYSSSTSGVLLQTNTFRPSTNMFSSSPNPAWVGSNVTFTATVSGSGGTPTGKVVFFDGTNNLGSVPLNAGVASVSTSALSVSGSPHYMTAVYGGDSIYSNTPPSALTQIITLRPSTTTISPSQNPAWAASNVTFTATVSGSGGPPTGKVFFYDGTNNLGSNTLNSLGVATISTSALSAGALPHSITAVYGGDSTFSNSTSSNLSQVITFRPSTNTLSSSPNPAWAASSVTFTATMSGSGVMPTGTVVFSYDETNNLGSNTLNSLGMASVTNSMLPVAGSPHSITAVYRGDNIYSNSTSTNSQVITFRPSTNMFSSSPNPAWVGSDVTFTATVSGSGGTPTGTVVFICDATNNLGSNTLNSLGMASVTNSALTVAGSPHSVTAEYRGDSTYSNTPPSALTQIITLRPSTTTISPSQNPSAAGSAVTFTAAVNGSGGTPTGTVFFYDDTNNLGSNTLNILGVATISTSSLSVSGSPHSISAVYGGDSTYSNSTSSALLQRIAYRPSATTIISSTNRAWAGSIVTFTATVSGSNGMPTGTVVFSYDETNNLGSNTLNGSGMASVTTSALPVAGSPHSVTAVYRGDSTFIGSTSTLSQVIDFAPSTTTIGSLPNPAWAASNVTFTATVSGSGVMPTGTVVFSYDGTNNLGSNTLDSLGMASVTNSALPVAGSPHSVTALYRGDSIYSNSTSTLSQVITFRPSTNTFSSSPNPAWVGSNVTFTATVSGSGGTPTGTVVFKDGTNILGSVPLNGSGTASLSTSALSVSGSPHYMTAVYGGDSTYSNTPPSALTQIITLRPSTNTISSSPNPSAAGSAVTFTAAVNGSGGTPTGTVVFYDGTNNLGSGTLNSGVATISTSSLSVSGSPHSISAMYGGDSTYSNSASGVLSQTIILAPSTTTISPSQNPAGAGSVVTFTATVSGIGGPPTGTVVFYIGTNNLGSGTLNSSGMASVSTSALSVNGSPHSISAVYSGDSTFSNSASGVLLEIITNSYAGASTNGLSASWPFKEGSGTAVSDSSGNGNTGTLNNSPLWVSGLAGNNALEFPGSYMPGAAYVSVPDSTTLADRGIGSNLTICAWVKQSPASLGNYCSVVAKDVLYDSPPYHRNYELIFDTGGRIQFVFMNSTGTSWQIYSSVTPYADPANWHFYCVTYTYGTASSCTLYFDGDPVPGGWFAGNGSDAPASTSGGPVLIGIDGTDTASGGSLYAGISIYNAVLSAPRILALYNSGISDGVASTTALASSQNPAVAGSAVTFTATVSGNGGTPAGTAVFYDGTNILGGRTLDSSGMANFSTGALSVSGSPHSITAVYSGDNAFGGSTSSALWQVITGGSGTVSIPLVDASFESPAGAQGTAAGVPDGWIKSNGDPYGVYNPPVGLYQGEVNDILPSPAQGSQVLYIQGGNYVAQFLTNTLTSNQTYTLSGAIGNRGDGKGPLGSDVDYVCLIAGGVFIAYNWDLPHPDWGTFLPWAITYTTGAAGFPSGTLEIRLGQNGVGEVDYDNITLTSAPSNQIVQDPPVITVQPTNQTVPAGSSPLFSVAAAGTEPLGYAWYVAGTNLLQSGASNTLALPSVLAVNAGNYTVVVTNVYGSVTSAVAALVVTIPVTPPRIMADDSNFGFLASQFGFYLGGAFGQTIVVDGSTNLMNWTPLFTNTVDGIPFYFRDPASAGFPWRFYRARLP